MFFSDYSSEKKEERREKREERREKENAAPADIRYVIRYSTRELAGK